MIIKRFLRALKTYSDNRAAYWQLMNMTDRELQDLGICRGEIKRLTMGE
mgnify:CR=1 FL=1|jgi:uncharacterized protein YjiS (DUF1127 family)